MAVGDLLFPDRTKQLIFTGIALIQSLVAGRGPPKSGSVRFMWYEEAEPAIAFLFLGWSCGVLRYRWRRRGQRK
jgi:hypothetical protein